MNVEQLFPSKYIKAGDLNGGEPQLTIRDVVIEDLVEGEQRPVMYFAGATKGLVLNRTNAATVAAVYGDETDNWKGREVVLFAATTQFKAQMVPCVRLRIPVAAPNVPQQAVAQLGGSPLPAGGSSMPLGGSPPPPMGL